MNRIVRVAAIQSVSLNGGLLENLSHLDAFVAEAKCKGAQIVLLPEFISTGFELNDLIWESAEPSHGPTVQWLQEQASKHAIWIGTSYLEADGSRFFNTFVMMDADGKVAARIRKGKPAATESYFFEGDPSNRVVKTPFGNIGISICYESFFASTVKELQDNRADLVLIPMSAPTPSLNPPVTQKDLNEYDTAVKDLATVMAIDLGVPVVMANKTGAWKTKPPFPFPMEDSSFPGFSCIADGDGQVVAALGDEEGIVIGNISMNPEKKKTVLPKMCGKWTHKPPRLFKLFIISEFLGKLKYRLSLKRRKMARIKSQQA